MVFHKSCCDVEVGKYFNSRTCETKGDGFFEILYRTFRRSALFIVSRSFTLKPPNFLSWQNMDHGTMGELRRVGEPCIYIC